MSPGQPESLQQGLSLKTGYTPLHASMFDARPDMRLLLAILCLWVSATAALAERRVALVIGNSAYASAPQLKNPVSDALAVEAALGRMGFEVLLGTDLDIDAMRDLLREFGLAADGADLALFFYAGHGLQVAGRNYLIPIDAELERESDLDFAAIDLQLVLKQLELASGNSVILLDACRDNPFETRLSRAMGAARSTAVLARGLAPVETLGGALIGFATDPGEVAYDGDGANSPFTEALLTHIETPGLEINALMTRVRADVVTRTGRLQRPWSTSSLLDEVFLAPAVAAPVAEVDPILADVERWKAADQDGSRAAVLGYLQEFPDGLFAEMARDRLAAMDAAPVVEETAALKTPETAPDLAPDPALDAASRGDTPTPKQGDATCSQCPAFVSLPGGSFRMGSASGEATKAERPVTTIDLPPFAMSVGEITVAEYRHFVETSGYRPANGCYVWASTGKMRFQGEAGWAAPGFEASDDMPAACVNWQDAEAYAQWLAVTIGQSVRLPSEAELEYAIRAGRADDYPFDGSAAGACAAVNAADASSRFAWRNKACDDGYPEVAPAGHFPPNAYGLLAVTGNLWEWAADCWSPTLKGARSDGAAKAGGACESRALRGGSWDDPVKNLRSAYRVGIPATRRQANVGFRVVIAN